MDCIVDPQSLKRYFSLVEELARPFLCLWLSLVRGLHFRWDAGGMRSSFVGLGSGATYMYLRSVCVCPV